VRRGRHAESQMAYNKSKLVANAQKLLHQGKVGLAIQEYVQILKQEPKDQATLMTLGDLYVRQGETLQALEYFERLAQIYLADGFVTKAIAIYKKIAKLAPEETRPVEKLAELYVQQGILSEARPIYLQLADLHQRAGRQQQAAALLRKLLEAEPENLRVLTRVAELSLAMNQPGDAAAAFRNAAEQMHNRGNHAEAVKLADRATKIDAKDKHVPVIKARALAAMGQHSEAMELLSSLPELEHGGDVAELLLHLYLQEKQTEQAIGLASKIFARNSANFAPLRQVSAKLLEGQQPHAALPLIDLIRAAMTEKGEHEALAQMLGSAAERLPANIEAREWLVELYKQTSDSFHLSEAKTGLAAAYKAAGDRKRALQIYEELLEKNPENEAIRQEYEKLNGKSPAEASSKLAEEPSEPPKVAGVAPPKAVQVSAPKAAPAAATSGAPADSTEAGLDPDTQQFLTQALTDIDLFSSYGLTQKAIDLLEIVLQRVPGHPQTLERLLDLYLGAGDEPRTAELAAQLEKIHTERGNDAAAERFADLRQRFGQVARTTGTKAAKKHRAKESPVVSVAAAADLDESSTPAEVVEPEKPAPQPASKPATQEAAVHELDLSEEWAALATELDTTPNGTEAAPAAESAPQTAPEFDVPAGKPPAVFDKEAEMQAALRAGSPASASKGASNADYDLELDTSPNANKASRGPSTAKDFLEALSSDLDAALPSLKAGRDADGAQREPSAPKTIFEPAPANSPPLSDGQSSPLSEIFDQFRSEVGELGAEDEDLETHYNLGIAYREMGLIEEAISEFQKVAKGSSKGQAFRYAMQCCTLLGLAFMEKGQPAIAATWYERALAMPGLDQESILALRYDLGVAQELAGDMAAARKSFSQVYGMNIDYRDVAERLSSLGNER
jgi:tetratricopeptide (TPR) repeat protein